MAFSAGPSVQWRFQNPTTTSFTLVGAKKPYAETYPMVTACGSHKMRAKPGKKRVWKNPCSSPKCAFTPRIRIWCTPQYWAICSKLLKSVAFTAAKMGANPGSVSSSPMPMPVLSTWYSIPTTPASFTQLPGGFAVPLTALTVVVKDLLFGKAPMVATPGPT